MKTKEKLLISMIIAMLLFTLIGGGKVKASDFDLEFNYQNITFLDQKEQKIIQIYSEEETDNSEIEGVKYDKSTNTLTLKDLTTNFVMAIIDMGEDFKIDVEGTNSVSAILSVDTYITIAGTGTLNITGNDEGTYGINLATLLKGTKLIIEDTVNVNIYANKNEKNEELGLILIQNSLFDKANDAIVLKNGQELDIKQEKVISSEYPQTIEALQPYKHYVKYTKCVTKTGEIYGRDIEDEIIEWDDETEDFVSRGKGYYLYKLIYDKEKDTYIQDGSVNITSVLTKDFKDSEFTETDEIIKSVYMCDPSYYNIAKDNNNNIYVIRNSYEYDNEDEEDFEDYYEEEFEDEYDNEEEFEDEYDNEEEFEDEYDNEEEFEDEYDYEDEEDNSIKVYNISKEKIKLSNGEYPIIEKNDEIDGSTLTPLMNSIKYYNYKVDDKTIQIKAKTTTEEPKEEEPKTEEPKEEKKLEIKVQAAKDNKENSEAKEKVFKLIESVADGKEVNGISESLAKEIKEAIENAKTVTVELTAPEVKREEIEDDAEKVETKISNDSKIAAYFDIDISIIIDGVKKGNVTQLNDKITITVPVPTDLPAIQNGYTRQFSIVRVHDGVAEELNTSVSGDTASFETDRFSTYALTYKDVKNTSNPVTGDAIIIFVALFIIAIVSSTICIIKLRKK